MSGDLTFVGRDPGTGRLLEVRTDGAVIADVRHVESADARQPWLSPGFVDLQVNGFGGYDANATAASADEVVALARALARVGTTAFVPTVITASEESMTRSLRAVVEARKSDSVTWHAIPFIHLEGPHISPEEGPRGAHPVEEIRPPDVEEFARWQKAAEGLVGIVTLSPHHPGSAEYIASLTAAGVRVAIGHTHATDEQVHAAADAGACLSTHLGNGAHWTIPRHPNYIWAQLADDRLKAGFIADGHHLPGDTLKSMLRAKGLDQSFLVSDSAALAGMPPGEYVTPVGGSVHLEADGRLTVAGSSYLAGAARSLAEGVAGACRLAGLALGDAVRLATINPGRLAQGRGRLVRGAPADLLLFDHAPGDTTLCIRQVVQQGLVLG